MKTLIINGSPKGNSSESNSKLIADAFIRKMKEPCEIRAIANENIKELAIYAKSFDSIIVVMPLYIHAMPGIVMRFFENLEGDPTHTKRIGFIIQSGFLETAQQKYLKAYLEVFSRQLNYQYLGCVSKGEAAGIYTNPWLFRKVFKQLNDLGIYYEETYTFDHIIMRHLEKPYVISKQILFVLKLMEDLGLSKIWWHKLMKKNGALDMHLDKPFQKPIREILNPLVIKERYNFENI